MGTEHRGRGAGLLLSESAVRFECVIMYVGIRTCSHKARENNDLTSRPRKVQTLLPLRLDWLCLCGLDVLCR